MKTQVVLFTVLAMFAWERVFAAEGRTPIFEAVTITTPGHYIVTQSISANGAAPVITINTSGVDLDLNGFILDNATGPAPVITTLNAQTRVSIRNGTVIGGGIGLQLGNYQNVVENMTVYQPTGIGISITSGTHHLIRNVTIDNPGGDAIYLFDTTTLVDDVRIRFAGGHGIHVDQGNGVTVSNCSIAIAALNGIYFDDVSSAAAINNQMSNIAGEGIRIDAIGLGARAWDNRVFSTSHAIHISGGSAASLMRNAVRSSSGHGIYVQAGHTVVEANQADSCLGFGLYLAAGSNFSSYGRNAMRENQGTLTTCTGGLSPPDSCDEGGANTSFGDNLIPTLQ